MADAYGKIIFNHSKDCSFDTELLLKKLNQYKWADDLLIWVCNEDEICTAESTYMYPTAFLNKIVNVEYLDSNEDIKWSSSLEEIPSIEDIEIEEFEELETSLEEISEDICQAIRRGWIEIGIIANEKGRYAYYESLRVDHTGAGTRVACLTGSDDSLPLIETTY